MSYLGTSTSTSASEYDFHDRIKLTKTSYYHERMPGAIKETKKSEPIAKEVVLFDPQELYIDGTDK